MRMWPISMRVNKPEHDDPAILDQVDTRPEGEAAPTLDL
jgi:hypothetical protein